MGTYRDFLVDCLYVTQFPFCVRWTKELYEVHYLCGFDVDGRRVVFETPGFLFVFCSSFFPKGRHLWGLLFVCTYDVIMESNSWI